MQCDGLAADTHLDVGDSDEFDVGGSQFGLQRGALDRRGSGLDVPHRRIGQRDRREFSLDALDVGLCGVDLGEPARQPVGLVPVGHLLDGAAGGVDAALTRLNRRARLFGGRLGGLLHVAAAVSSSSWACAAAVSSSATAAVRSSTSARSLRRSVSAETLDAERRVCGRGDHLRLLELLGQRGDLLRLPSARSPGSWPPPSARRTVASRSAVSVACVAHRIVDLGDRGRTPGHLVVGVPHPLGRGGPLAGRAAGGCEVPQVFGVDAVDQQRLGARQLHRLTGCHVERPGQRIAPGQVHRCGRRRLQHALRLPQIRRRRSRR